MEAAAAAAAAAASSAAAAADASAQVAHNVARHGHGRNGRSVWLWCLSTPQVLHPAVVQILF